MLHSSLAFIRTLPSVAVATLLGLAVGAVSADTSSGVREVDQRDWRGIKVQFLQADDFDPISAAEFESWFDDGWYTDERFGSQGESVFLPDAQMSPIERSVLLFEHLEGTLPHVRYRITLGTEFPTVESDLQSPLAFIEVTRFNLGPALHADLLTQYDEVADLDQFGVGPHVARRFVFTPMQALNAHLLGAARKELGDEQAMAEQCFGQPCLSLETNIGTVGNWQVVNAGNDSDFNPSVAQVSAELAELHIGDEYGEPVESIQAPAPYLSFIIEQNIAGQVPTITAVSHQDHLMDDALAAIWYQRLQADGMPPHWERLIEYRRVGGR